MTRRNSVSKEGARGEERSDKPHNARDALLDLCARQSRSGGCAFWYAEALALRAATAVRARGKDGGISDESRVLTEELAIGERRVSLSRPS